MTSDPVVQAKNQETSSLTGRANWFATITVVTKPALLMAPLRSVAWPMQGANSIANKSQLAEQALDYIKQLYLIERELSELTPDERRHQRQERAKPIADQLNLWLMGKRQQVPVAARQQKRFNTA